MKNKVKSAKKIKYTKKLFIVSPIVFIVTVLVDLAVKFSYTSSDPTNPLLEAEPLAVVIIIGLVEIVSLSTFILVLVSGLLLQKKEKN